MTTTQRNSLYPIAAVPLLFGLHQIAEGFVWIDPTNIAAVRTFAYVAYCFWPIYVPAALYYAEKQRNFEKSESDRLQMKRIVQCTQMAIPVGLLLLICVMAEEPLQVSLENGHARYHTCQIGMPNAVIQTARAIYGISIVAAAIYSSVKYAWLVGVATGMSFLFTIVMYEAEFESTWCYFSALSSVVVLWAVWMEIHSYPALKKVA